MVVRCGGVRSGANFSVRIREPIRVRLILKQGETHLRFPEEGRREECVLSAIPEVHFGVYRHAHVEDEREAVGAVHGRAVQLQARLGVAKAVNLDV